MSTQSDIDFFAEHGYVIMDLFSESQIDEMAALVRARVLDVTETNAADAAWPLGEYHLHIGADDERHKEVTRSDVRYITFSEQHLQNLLQQSMRDLMTAFWGHDEVLLTHRRGALDAPMQNDGTTGFRLARPGRDDAVGVHVDRYYGNIDGIDDVSVDKPSLVTAWIPVVGFDSRYSLRISPGTHRIEHPNEAFKKMPGYITHTCTPEYEAKFDYIRPDLKKGQSIVFHPNLMHGRSTNEGTETRVSLEPRIRDRRVFSIIEQAVAS